MNYLVYRLEVTELETNLQERSCCHLHLTSGGGDRRTDDR